MYCSQPLKTLQAVALLTLLAGCSVSYSVEKSSDSISESLDSVSASFDSFGSVSGSSSGSDAEVASRLTRYLDDISGLARYWAERETDAHGFEHQLEALSLGHGISNWNTEPLVFKAIGEGLKRAGVERQAISDLRFLQTSLMVRHQDHILSAYLES